MKKIVIGIDISKKTLDWCVLNGKEFAGYHRTANSVDAIAERLAKVLEGGRTDVGEVLVCAEFTGRYIHPLVLACHRCGVDLWLESGYNIKCEARKERGKDDRTDARRIAEYGRKNQDDARIYRLPSESIATLRDLLSERAMYCSQRAAYKGQLRDMRDYMEPKAYTARAVRQQALIKELDRLVGEIDDSMAEIVSSDPELRRQQELLLTVPGIGMVCAAALIAVTAGFTLFDNGRELCCFAGLAPFAYTSGTSIRSRHRVSGRADHELKALLHMCALVAATRIKSGHFAEYYQRKVSEGKSKMSVLNAVRAKLMLTAFSVVRNNTPYDKNFKKNLQNHKNPLIGEQPSMFQHTIPLHTAPANSSLLIPHSSLKTALPFGQKSRKSYKLFRLRRGDIRVRLLLACGERDLVDLVDYSATRQPSPLGVGCPQGGVCFV